MITIQKHTLGSQFPFLRHFVGVTPLLEDWTVGASLSEVPLQMNLEVPDLREEGGPTVGLLESAAICENACLQLCTVITASNDSPFGTS